MSLARIARGIVIGAALLALTAWVLANVIVIA